MQFVFPIFAGGRLSQDSVIPYPWANIPKVVVAPEIGAWTSEMVNSNQKRHRNDVLLPQKKTKHPSLTDHFGDYVQEFPHLLEIQKKLDDKFPGKIEWRLPRFNAVAGGVLQHCSSVVEKLLETQSPMAFKIGYTHNPLWRWGNRLYGYCHEKIKWSTMILLYATDQPYGPSMLEAALIDKYKSTSPEIFISTIYITHTEKNNT